MWLSFRNTTTALLLGLTLSAPVAAQSVRGTVVEEESRLPIEGALVVLVPPQGDSSHAGTLTDAEGRYRLTGEPGLWRLRVDRIGHRSVHSAPFELTAGREMAIPLRAPVEAVSVEAVDVRTSSRGCSMDPQEGVVTARLWDEARKALANAYWSRDEVLRFEAVVHERRLDPETLTVVDQQTERRTSGGDRPFTTLSPESLASRGYVQPTDSGTYYYAPDEQVLLSDTFLTDHCFRVRADGDPELIGLAFEPVDRSAGVDIEGTLWLDRESSHLRFLEYEYVNLQIDVPDDEVGGRVEFQRLPTGAWIARRWWIRMPVVQEQRTLTLGIPVTTRELGAILERGGEVVALETRDGGRIAGLDRPRIHGLVYDSVNMRPLADARVALEGTDERTRTDRHGRFTLSGPEGNYRLTYSHPVLDSVGYEPPPLPVAMRSGVVREARLAIPSLETILARGCSREEGRAVLVGTVRGPQGRLAPDADARIAWRPRDGALRHRSAATDHRGRFVVCNVPSGPELLVRAVLDDQTSQMQRLSAAPGEVVRTELQLDSIRTATVTGHVTDRESGHALPQASVHVQGTGLITLTDEDGAFSLRQVPPGIRVFEVAHLAYGQQIDSLQVEPGSRLLLDVGLSPGAIALEPLTVTAERRYRTPGLEGFYDRREQNLGRYVTAEQIEDRQQRRLREVLRSIPGLTVACGQSSPLGSGCIIQFERARSRINFGGEEGCPIQYFLDGTRTAREIIEAIRMDQVEGIEVYNGMSDVPPQFRRGPDTRCGVVAVWLKSGR